MDPRIGDLVERNGISGVIFAIESEEDDGAYPDISIRWSNGLSEKIAGGDFEEDITITTPLLYVNVYLEDKECGGPEEGGWWYYVKYPEESILCDSEEDAKKVYDKKVEEYDEENDERPSISSVLSRGRYLVELDAHPGEVYPRHRPRYC